MNLDRAFKEAFAKEAAGPAGFWCRYCGEYQSTRGPAEASKAMDHLRAHQAAGDTELPKEERPGFFGRRKTAATLVQVWGEDSPLDGPVVRKLYRDQRGQFMETLMHDDMASVERELDHYRGSNVTVGSMRKRAEDEAALEPCDSFTPEVEGSLTCGNCYWTIGSHDVKAGGTSPVGQDPYYSHTMKGLRKGAPFAGYEDFDSCVAANSDKDDPEAYCGKIKHEVEARRRPKAHKLGSSWVVRWQSPDSRITRPSVGEFPTDAAAQAWLDEHVHEFGDDELASVEIVEVRQGRKQANPYTPSGNPFTPDQNPYVSPEPDEPEPPPTGLENQEMEEPELLDTEPETTRPRQTPTSSLETALAHWIQEGRGELVLRRGPR